MQTTGLLIAFAGVCALIASAFYLGRAEGIRRTRRLFMDEQNRWSRGD